jgi:hypothetical protein
VSPRLQLKLERMHYAPGETVKGMVLVLEGGASRSLEAVLAYNEETSDYSEVAISIPSGPLQEGELTAGTSYEFELPLPPDALPNYASGHGALYWAVDARSDEFARDTHARARIEVEPPHPPPPGGVADVPPTGGAPARAPPASPVSKSKRRRRGSAGAQWLLRAFVAIGVLALAWGAIDLVRTVHFVKNAEHATGTVVDVSREIDDEGDEFFYPVVRFTTAEGKEFEFKSDSGSNPASHSTGDEVDVLYDPDDPDDAQLSGFFDLWLFTIVPFAIGTGFLGVAGFQLRRVQRA